jgi:hypothetical protein
MSRYRCSLAGRKDAAAARCGHHAGVALAGNSSANDAAAFQGTELAMRPEAKMDRAPYLSTWHQNLKGYRKSLLAASKASEPATFPARLRSVKGRSTDAAA